MDSFKYGFNADLTSYGRLCQDVQHIQTRTTVLANLNLFKTCGAVRCTRVNNVEIYCVNVPTFSRRNSGVSFQGKN